MGSTLATDQTMLTMPAWVAEQVSAWMRGTGSKSLTLHQHRGTVGVIEVSHGACPMCGQPMKERLTKPN